MKRRIKSYFKGGSLVLGLALAVYGIVLTIKNDTNLISIEARYFWLILLPIILIILLLVIALYNQDKILKEVDEYRIERYYPNNNTLVISYLPILNYDHLVTIATEQNGREEILGIGKVINVKTNHFIELEIIHCNENPLWDAIKHNDKNALNKTYILPTIRDKEVKNCD